MRKGTWAPRVRCRFCKTQFERTEQQWPVWLNPALSGVYIYFIGPLPVPVSLVPDDCSPGCWSYVPSTGSIRWEGDFDALAVFGRWAVEVHPDYNKILRCRYGLKWTDAALNTGSFMTDATTDTRTDFIGPTTLAIDNSQTRIDPGPDGFVFSTTPGSYGLTYKQIFEAGIDAENTAPVSFTAPTDPW